MQTVGHFIGLLTDTLTETKKFKIKITNDNDLQGRILYNGTAKHKKHGVILKWSYTHAFGHIIQAKVRTKGAGYRIPFTWFIKDFLIAAETDPNALHNKIQEIIEVVNGLVVGDDESLPAPWEFNKSKFYTPYDNYISLRSEIASAHVKKLVTINAGKITENITEPNAKCWYLMSCSGHKGAGFTILFDGDVFYPTNESSITRGAGKITVNLKNCSIIDKELLTEAVKKWSQGLCG